MKTLSTIILITILFILLVIAISYDYYHNQADQCIRREVFKECMKSLPAGPASTRYNDWDEVVKACEETAYYQSVRPTSVIKEECRGF